MSKKYLIDETERWAVQQLTGRHMSAKEVEVLDINSVIVEAATDGIRLHDYLKANKYLIVKIIE